MILLIEKLLWYNNFKFMCKDGKKVFEQIIDIDNVDHISSLFGNFDENVRMVEQHYSVNVTSQSGNIKVCGEQANVISAARTLDGMLMLIKKGDALTAQNIEYVMSLVDNGEDQQISKLADANCICITSKGRPVKAKTIGQQKYIDAIKNNTITIGVGPAGTGKTYLAVALAANEFRAKRVSRIILTRPAVEAGEKLGFLPGDLQQKVDPYLRPLYDALVEMMGMENFHRCQERGDIEVAPLAYMRGRTLDDSFIILDEAQNTTSEQMKMFLTRLGFNSRAVVTGDVTQIDLPDGKKSGLKEAVNVLKNIEDIAIIRLNDRDVVRHRLVQRIINAYNNYKDKKENNYAKNKG